MQGPGGLSDPYPLAPAESWKGQSTDRRNRAEGDLGEEMPRVIDLTLTVRPGMRGVEFEKVHTVSQHGWNSSLLHLYSHSGTHMDSPLHFAAGTDTIDRIPL